MGHFDELLAERFKETYKHQEDQKRDENNWRMQESKKEYYAYLSYSNTSIYQYVSIFMGDGIIE